MKIRLKNFWKDDFILKQTSEDRNRIIKLYTFIVPLLIGVIYWDISQLGAKLVWHYVLLKIIVIGSMIFAMVLAHFNFNTAYGIGTIWTLAWLFIYSIYGMLFIDFTYCYSFWQIYFATSFFFRLSKKTYFLLMVFGGALNILALRLVAEPAFMKEGLSFKPHMAVVSGIIFFLSNLLFYTVTKKQEELFELQEKFALVGKQSSYVFHEIKKPINRLMSSDSFLSSDIQQINNILLNIELMLKNPANFKKSFEIFNLQDVFKNLETEFQNYFTEYDIEFNYPNIKKKIIGNESLIYQVFKNLIVNSVEAIALNEGFKETKQINIQYTTESINFQNTGSSISKTDADKIFNPFYTTKKNGVNTGLGLSFCKNIIEGHEGSIKLNALKSGPEFVISI